MHDDLFQRPRQISRLQAVDHPLPAHQVDLAVGDQLADDLSQEERVALSYARQFSLEMVRGAQTWEYALQVFSDVVLVQRPQLHATDAQLFVVHRIKALERRSLLLPAQLQKLQRRAADEQREFLGLNQHAQQQQRRLVGELQVVDDQDERPKVGDPWQEFRQRGKDGLPSSRSIGARISRARLAELWKYVGQVLDLVIGQVIEQLGTFVLTLVQQRQQDAAAQVVGAIGLPRVAGFLHYAEGVVAAEVAADRLQEGRLAHTRRRLEDHELAVAAARGHQRLGHDCHLVVAPGDARRFEAIQRRLGKDFRRVDVRRARDLVAARPLGVEEGGIGRLEQLAPVGRVVGGRREPDAQADGDAHLGLAQAERPVAGSL